MSKRKSLFIIFYLALFVCGLVYQDSSASDSQIRHIRNFVPFSNTDRVLIIAPHPDDETIGCAGIIQKAITAGADTRVLYLTNGDHNQLAFMVYEKRITIRRGEFIHMGEVRRKEAINAMKLLGLEENKLIFLGYPDFGTLVIFRQFWREDKPYKSILTRVDRVPYEDDLSYGSLYTGINILEDFKKALSQFRPNKIFVTSSIDTNSDHKAAYLFLEIALSDLREELPAPEIYTYLIHWKGWPLPRNYHADKWISPPKEFSGDNGITWYKNILSAAEEEKKYKATLCYKSQTESSAFYLLAFTRRNELFAQYPQIDIYPDSRQVCPETEKRVSWLEKAGLFFGLSKDDFWIDGPSIQKETASAGEGKCALGYELSDDFFIMRIGKEKNMHSRCINLIYIYGYSHSEEFKRMPKIRVTTRYNKFRVFDGNKIINPKNMVLDFKPEEVILKIPLKVLGNPDYVLASLRSNTLYYCVDRMVFRKVNIHRDKDNTNLALADSGTPAEIIPAQDFPPDSGPVPQKQEAQNAGF